MQSLRFRRLCLLALTCASAWLGMSAASLSAADPTDAERARRATIHRDKWGVAHIDGPTDADVVFALAYAQAEDFFWQIEDSYAQALGRYAELQGESGLTSDFTNHAFEITARSQQDFPKLDPQLRAIATAYGILYPTGCGSAFTEVLNQISDFIYDDRHDEAAEEREHDLFRRFLAGRRGDRGRHGQTRQACQQRGVALERGLRQRLLAQDRSTSEDGEAHS